MSEKGKLEQVLEQINQLSDEDQQKLCEILEVEPRPGTDPDDGRLKAILAAARELEEVTARFNAAYETTGRLARQKNKAEAKLRGLLRAGRDFENRVDESAGEQPQ